MMWNKKFTNMTNNNSEEYNGCRYWTGKEIFSTVLPNINIKNKSTIIENGKLKKGYLVKKESSN